MSDYTKTTNFTAKDALSSGDPDKLIKGSLFDTEFDNIATAVATKYDVNDLASQAQAEALSSNTVLMTPGRVANVLNDNAGILGDLQALADPNADRLLFWDDGAGAAAFLTATDGVEVNGTDLRIASTAAGAGLTYTTGVLAVGAGSGITVNANDVQITDVSAGSAQPVAISSGTFSFDLSSITEIEIDAVDYAADGICVSDAGTLKILPFDQTGVDIFEFTLDDALDATHVGKLCLLTGAVDKTLDIPTNASVAFNVGTIILVGSRDTADLTVSPDTGVTLTSLIRSASGASGDHTLLAGGMAMLLKVATNEWMIVGDVT